MRRAWRSRRSNFYNETHTEKKSRLAYAVGFFLSDETHGRPCDGKQVANDFRVAEDVAPYEIGIAESKESRYVAQKHEALWKSYNKFS